MFVSANKLIAKHIFFPGLKVTDKRNMLIIYSIILFVEIFIVVFTYLDLILFS